MQVKSRGGGLPKEEEELGQLDSVENECGHLWMEVVPGVLTRDSPY